MRVQMNSGRPWELGASRAAMLDSTVLTSSGDFLVLKMALKGGNVDPRRDFCLAKLALNM